MFMIFAMIYDVIKTLHAEMDLRILIFNIESNAFRFKKSIVLEFYRRFEYFVDAQLHFFCMGRQHDMFLIY